MLTTILNLLAHAPLLAFLPLVAAITLLSAMEIRRPRL